MEKNKYFSKDGMTEFYIKPDLIIVENGIGPPKIDLSKVVEQKDSGALNRIGIAT